MYVVFSYFLWQNNISMNVLCDFFLQNSFPGVELLGQIVYAFEIFIALVQLPSEVAKRIYTPDQL